MFKDPLNETLIKTFKMQKTSIVISLEIMNFKKNGKKLNV